MQRGDHPKSSSVCHGEVTALILGFIQSTTLRKEFLNCLTRMALPYGTLPLPFKIVIPKCIFYHFFFFSVCVQNGKNLPFTTFTCILG